VFDRYMAEVTDKQSRRYYPSATDLVTCCEVNYMLLQKLIPHTASINAVFHFSVAQGNQYQISVLEISRYTSVIEMSQINTGIPDYLRPSIHVRMYHDAKAAEVIKSANVSRIQPKYEYPNDKMHQPDEKMQINLFLGEWLKFCIEHGLSEQSSVELSAKDE
jgi:uncharacterized protein YqiB (DUF1249 family)